MEVQMLKQDLNESLYDYNERVNQSLKEFILTDFEILETYFLTIDSLLMTIIKYKIT